MGIGSMPQLDLRLRGVSFGQCNHTAAPAPLGQAPLAQRAIVGVGREQIGVCPAKIARLGIEPGQCVMPAITG
jgi:hypothetical protein